MPFTRRLLAAVAGLAIAAGLPAVPAAAAPEATVLPTLDAAKATSARTSAAEARRIDRVRTPKLHWYSCYVWAQCATAKVPLDYDHPYGKQTTITLVRVKARDQKHKIGSLTGPFTRRTANTVLLVGSYWDPTTNYRDAVIASRNLPNSRLLSSNHRGHTAYGTSACATGAIDRYLLHKTLPAKGKVCAGEDQPYTTPLTTNPELGESLSADEGSASIDAAVAGLPVPGTAKQLPPIGRTFTVR